MFELCSMAGVYNTNTNYEKILILKINYIFWQQKVLDLIKFTNI